MKRHRSYVPYFLLDPNDPNIHSWVSELICELKSFEGKTFQEMVDEVEEINRNDTKEERRKLRIELAEHFAEGSEVELPHGLISSKIRRHLFSTVWERGMGFVAAEPDLFQPSSEEIFAEVARKLDVDPATLRKSMYLDIREAYRVNFPQDVEKLPAAAILGALNLNRLKQRLKRAASLRLELPESVERGSPYAAVLWSLKHNRLMYDVSLDGETFLIIIRGAGALFGKSTMYGNRLASFAVCLLRHIQAGFPWALEAEMMEYASGSTRILRIDSTMKQLFSHAGDEAPEDDFKSSDEAAFQRYFSRIESSWELQYEGTIVSLAKPDGTRAGFMIPDFVARNVMTGRRVLIEIVGFWREEYLKRKMEKVAMLGNVPIILLVNKTLSAGRSTTGVLDESPNVNILFYSGRSELKILAADVIALLEGC